MERTTGRVFLHPNGMTVEEFSEAEERIWMEMFVKDNSTLSREVLDSWSGVVEGKFRVLPDPELPEGSSA